MPECVSVEIRMQIEFKIVDFTILVSNETAIISKMRTHI